MAEEVVEDEFAPEVDEDTGEKEDPDVPEDNHNNASTGTIDGKCPRLKVKCKNKF